MLPAILSVNLNSLGVIFVLGVTILYCLWQVILGIKLRGTSLGCNFTLAPCVLLRC